MFHFAAQVAVTTSLVDPIADFEVNARGTINLLEAIRAQPEPPPLVFTSTNKVYGKLADVGLELDGERYAPTDPGDPRPAASTSPARSISTAPMARPRAAPISMCWIIAGPTTCRRRCSG